MTIPRVVRILVPEPPRVVRVNVRGLQGPPGVDPLDSIAELRAYSRPAADGTFLQVKSWWVGLRRGGGYFQYDAADTTGADDGGMVIVDARDRRWKRILPDGRVCPTMWGAKADSANVDDSDAINSMFDALRTALAASTSGMAPLIVDSPGLVFGAHYSINATNIRSNTRNFTLGRLAILASADPDSPFAPAFDLGNSIFYEIEALVVRGDTANPPDIGVLQARAGGSTTLPHPVADRGHIRHIEVFGRFGSVGLLNLAAETYRYDFIRTSNDNPDPLACCRMMIGAETIFFNRYGRHPVSKFYSVGLDVGGAGQSLSSTSIGQNIDQRSPAYNLSISLSKANPAVGTFASPADQATAVANGFANGGSVHLITVGNGTGIDNWAHKSSQVWTIQNSNSTAHTFELAGLDSSAVSDNLVSAFIKNNAGPAVILGHLGQYTEENGYVTTFGRSKLLLDTRTGPDGDRNWQIKLRARHELGTPYLIEILGDGSSRDVRGLSIATDNENSSIAPIRISGVTAGGIIRLSDFTLELGHNAQSPEKIFDVDDPSYLAVFGGKVVTLLNSLTNTAEPNEEDFSEATFDLIRPGATPRVRHIGSRLATGTWTFQKSASNVVGVRLDCLDDGSAPGPRMDLRRISASPANADILGQVTIVGRDSAGNDTVYGLFRAIAKIVTDGSEDGQVEMLVAANGALNTRIWAANRYGAQGGDRTQTISTDANFTLTPLSNPVETFHTGTLTQDRIATLSVVGAFDGCRFKITRTGAGAFNLNVNDSVGGLLKGLATGTWGVFIFDGTAGAWKLAAYGSL